VDKLKENGLDDVLIVVGGIIPEEDVEPLRQAGVKGVFGPGTSTEDIVAFIREQVNVAN
jgi:methylmalonyl-CoA mutase C-terminal domain/subunit